tara:strand:- start:1081 stop:1437 length:357 start_codon:yes stop_codon:yes gene_type:complete
MSCLSVEAFLNELREHRQDQFQIIVRLREMVLAAGSAITEEVKYGGLLFSSNVGFCGIFVYAAHVALEFSKGAALPDPHGVLAGGGKHRRHIKILAMQDVETKHVEKYVAFAYTATFD